MIISYEIADATPWMRVIGFTAAGHCGPDHGDTLRTSGAHEIATTADALASCLAELLADRAQF